jgi:adenosylhomocysteine nucleosidase
LLVADSIASAEASPLLLAAHYPLPTTHYPLTSGRLLAVDHVVRLPSEKQELGRKHEALAADMESLAVAEVCRDRGVPFLAVRIISDAADEALPPDVEHLLAQPGGPRQWGAALGAICRRPSSAKDLLRLWHHANEDSDRLAKYLTEVVAELD